MKQDSVLEASTTQTPMGEQSSEPAEDDTAAGATGQPKGSKSNKRAPRGLREILALGQVDLPASGGRPARRAAAAAQAAVAHTIAFERHKGNRMTPPKPPGSLGLAQRMLQAFEGTLNQAAATPSGAAAAAPGLPASKKAKGRRQASVTSAVSPAETGSGAAEASPAGAANGVEPGLSRQNGAPAGPAGSSDWDDFQSPAGRKKRPVKKASRSGSRKGKGAARPHSAASENLVPAAADEAQVLAAAGQAQAHDIPAAEPAAVAAEPAAVAAAQAAEAVVPAVDGAHPKLEAVLSVEGAVLAAAAAVPAAEHVSAAEAACLGAVEAPVPAPEGHDLALAGSGVELMAVDAEVPAAPAIGGALKSDSSAGGAGSSELKPVGLVAKPDSSLDGGASGVRNMLPQADSDQPDTTTGPAAADVEITPAEATVSGPAGDPAAAMADSAAAAAAVQDPTAFDARGPPATTDVAAMPDGSAACAAAAAPAAAVMNEVGGLAAAAAAATAAQPQPLLPSTLSHYPQEAVRLAALVRTALGLQKGQQANLRMVMKTGLLAGQEVRFQNKAGKVLNRGVMNAQGFISCECSKCHGKSASCSEFEEHSGSRDRRPADGIFLKAFDISMRDLVALVNNPDVTGGVDVHMEACYACKEGGDLLCCDGCTAVYHLGCAQLEAVPEGDWFCPLCVSEGRNVKRLPQQSRPKMGRRSNAARPSINYMELSDDGAPSKPKKSEGAPTGRVHMAAPSMARRVTGVRRGRNSNKHKRLFEGGEGSLPNGEKVAYITTQGEKLLEGEVVISAKGPSGILCYCCNQVISCSQFEAHAGRGSRRAPYDNIFTSAGLTLKAIAAMLPELEEEQPGGPAGGEYDLDHIADGCREVINELDTVAGGCVLCHEVDFQRGGFGPRTVLFCDQCEREFHVGCLKKAGKCDLQAVPEGDWFCSQECTTINELLGSYIRAGQMEIEDSPQHTWQLLRGKDGSHSTAWSLKAAQELLQESFDPIMDLSTNTDLLPLMLYARQYGEWDYKNVHVMLLRHKGKPVVAAIMRVFGPQLAELPLIATKLSARRQGHARVLLKEYDKLLTKAGVHRLCLPAAHETVVTWRQGFHFVDMPEDQVKLAKQQLRILVFPGTEMLWKEVPGVAQPEGHHILVAPPESDNPTGTAEAGMEAARAAAAAGQAAAGGEAAMLVNPAGQAASVVGLGLEGHGAAAGAAEAPMLRQVYAGHVLPGPPVAQPAVLPSAPAGVQQQRWQHQQNAGVPTGTASASQWQLGNGSPGWGLQQAQQQQQMAWSGQSSAPGLPMQHHQQQQQQQAPYQAAQPYWGNAAGSSYQQGYPAYQAGSQQAFGGSRLAEPVSAGDPFTDSYDSMLAAAMLAADAAAEQQTQLPRPASASAPSASPALLPSQPFPGASPAWLQLPQHPAQPQPQQLLQNSTQQQQQPLQVQEHAVQQELQGQLKEEQGAASIWGMQQPGAAGPALLPSNGAAASASAAAELATGTNGLEVGPLVAQQPAVETGSVPDKPQLAGHDGVLPEPAAAAVLELQGFSYGPHALGSIEGGKFLVEQLDGDLGEGTAVETAGSHSILSEEGHLAKKPRLV